MPIEAKVVAIVFTGSRSQFETVRVRPERPSLSLVCVAAIVASLPGMLLLIGTVLSDGSTRRWLLFGGILCIDLQAICAICSYHKLPAAVDVWLPGIVAALMALLGMLLIIELGPLYLWPGSVLWAVISTRNWRTRQWRDVPRRQG